MHGLTDLLPTLLAQAANQAPSAPLPTGRITGGWGYVWFSYALTFLTLAGYGVSLWVRRPRPTKDV
ncbi:MAG: hypothetical protein IRZ16_15530 [Myxococcaceae bacterium]|nr:hypothetical protein [Myxococcaceae bacterium]